MSFPGVPDNQMEYVTDPYVMRSYEYYTTLHADAKKLINDYKAEMDPDDWAAMPLGLTYTVINWLLQHRAKHRRTIPNLLKEHALTKEQVIGQVGQAEELVKILQSFPKNEGKDIIVFRGETSTLGEYIKAKFRNPLKQVTLYSFLSTSLNPKVATAFNKGIILVITIPPGNPLPFISDHLSTNYPTGPESSESEVLLPVGSTFKIHGYQEHDTIDPRKPVTIFYLTLHRFGLHNTREAWTNYAKKAANVYNELHSSSANNRNTNNRNSKRITRRGGHKRRNKSRKIKRNST